MSEPISPQFSLERIMAVNHHLRLALNMVGDAVVVVESTPLTTRGPRVVYGNTAMSEATGVSAGRLCEMTLSELCGVEYFNELSQAMTVATEPLNLNGPLFHSDGSATPCLWSISPVLGSNGEILNFILTAASDVRPSRLAAPEIELAPLLDAAGTKLQETKTFSAPPTPEVYQQDLVETIRDTARYVAHEFNNALTSILVPVQIAIREVPNGGDLHGKLEVAYVSARRAADLAKDFLDCFRPRPPARELCQLNGLLGRAMRLATCAQNISWSMEIADDLLNAEVDPNQIERVIFNLVRNACQAMPTGGKLLVKATNAMVTADKSHTLAPGAYIHINVRDWGPGIPEEHMPHLFNSRFTTKEDGNGCGLPICYQIVKAHGGDMYVSTRPRVGTAFLIFLPGIAPAVENTDLGRSVTPPPVTLPDAPPTCQVLPPLAIPPTHEKPSLAPTLAEVSVPPSSSGPTMLVVDDEDGIRMAFTQIGRAYGFEVATAATSEEGLQNFKDRVHAKRPYDTVLLDLNLRGGLNGFEVFAAIKKIDPDASVIATSGQYTEDDIERFQDLGFAGFLPKPFTLEDFDQVMQDVLPS